MYRLVSSRARRLTDDVIEPRLVLVARIRSLLLGLIRGTRERNPNRTRFEP
jgi:hypothetical protein